MFEHAFLSHVTEDGTAIGVGAVWQNEKIYQIDLIADGDEGPWLAGLPSAIQQSARAQPERTAPLWLDLVDRLEGGPGQGRWDLADRGTPFQKRVWDVLLSIPRGDVLTYKQLAHRVNGPDGARAVAGGCGANPFLLLVPCHRVVGGQGKLGGFRAGVAIKRRLLKMEGADRGNP